ncbi:unnamed protein product [Bemisia tabaci]|uniref:Uncharacterized protein n=1 Tax=Bemisia tabaci TaxID=7038 RepID=A0A9P0A7L8_BEMTA|nr:unnamed protein product [Bemisia tabaci]
MDQNKSLNNQLKSLTERLNEFLKKDNENTSSPRRKIPNTQLSSAPTTNSKKVSKQLFTDPNKFDVLSGDQEVTDVSTDDTSPEDDIDDVFIQKADKEVKRILMQSKNTTNNKTKPKEPRSSKDKGDPSKDANSNPENGDKSETGENVPKVKPKRPTPIKITSADKLEEFVPYIKEALPDESLWSVQALNDGIFKVKPMTEEAHSLIREVLEKIGIKFYFYENKNTRPLRIIAKKLHESLSLDDIRIDLIKKGFDVVKVDNIIEKNRVTDSEGLLERYQEAKKWHSNDQWKSFVKFENQTEMNFDRMS